MSVPQITICLGFRNWHATHLQRCLQSLQQQYLPVYVVVADGSQIIANIVAMHGAGVIMSEMPEWSRSRALNLAAKHATTPWLCFTDADMIFAQNWRDEAERAIASRPEDGRWSLFLTPSRDMAPNVTRVFHGRTSQWDDESLRLLTTDHPRVGMGGGMLVQREWFTRVGGFDEFYKVWGCEDNDLALRAQWDDANVSWLDNTFVAHQYHDRDWPTQEQRAVVMQNRQYFAARMDEGGPIIRNRKDA